MFTTAREICTDITSLEHQRQLIGETFVMSLATEQTSCGMYTKSPLPFLRQYSTLKIPWNASTWSQGQRWNWHDCLAMPITDNYFCTLWWKPLLKVKHFWLLIKYLLRMCYRSIFLICLVKHMKIINSNSLCLMCTITLNPWFL